jgi:hypothetical protein
VLPLDPTHVPQIHVKRSQNRVSDIVAGVDRDGLLKLILDLGAELDLRLASFIHCNASERGREPRMSLSLRRIQPDAYARFFHGQTVQTLSLILLGNITLADVDARITPEDLCRVGSGAEGGIVRSDRGGISSFREFHVSWGKRRSSRKRIRQKGHNNEQGHLRTVVVGRWNGRKGVISRRGCHWCDSGPFST